MINNGVSASVDTVINRNASQLENLVGRYAGERIAAVPIVVLGYANDKEIIHASNKRSYSYDIEMQRDSNLAIRWKKGMLLRTCNICIFKKKL